MKTWAEFYDDVIPEVPGADTPIVDAALKRSAMEFLERARVYQADIAAMDAEASVGGYLWVSPDTDTDICHIFNVWYDGEKLTPRNGDYLADKYDYWPEEEGTPVHYLQERTDTLTLIPMPSEDLTGAITAKVALRTTLSSTGIPDDLYADYRDAIAKGALARLMRMPKKPWTNFDLAGAYGQAFQDAIDEAKYQQHKGNVRSTHHVPHPRSRFV